MVITELLERNARLYGGETALVEINPSEERDKAVSWKEASLIENASDGAPYRREISWKTFERQANRFANLLLSRGIKRGTKVGMLMMNCLEFLRIYFGILKAGCIVVPMNYRYASDEIKYCADLADLEVLVFGPEFIERMNAISNDLPMIHTMFFVGQNVPEYAEDCIRLMSFCSSSLPPVQLSEDDYAAIYFSSGTTGFPKGVMLTHYNIVNNGKCIGDRMDLSTAVKRRRFSLHSSSLSHRCQNALVRKSSRRKQGGAFKRRQARMDTAYRHRRKMHHRLAAGALGAGYSGRAG